MRDSQSFDEGPLADPEERQVVFAALDSFRQYRQDAHFNVTHRRRQNLYALPKHQWQILAAPPINLLDHLNAVDDALDYNADIADAILELGLQAFGLPAEPEKGSLEDWHGTAKPEDLAKAHSTIRQFYRDWSRQGFTAEVEPLLNTIVSDLTDLRARSSHNFPTPSLLLPGAGLGRLLFSLSLQGYNVEGNEISYHQLLASNFILNATSQAEQYTLYPFASTFTNNKKRANQLSAFLIPDIHPATTVLQQKENTRASSIPVGEMNMTSGDFLTSYGDAESSNIFDGVVTVYFIDTAPNLIRYIHTVRNCLKDGGLWVNIGPLLWHFDDRGIESFKKDREGQRTDLNIDEISMSSPQSVKQSSILGGIEEPGSFELSDEEVLSLLRTMGFAILKHEYLSPKNGGYIHDTESMIQSRYECSHWIARKLP